MLSPDIQSYHEALRQSDKEICSTLFDTIESILTQSTHKIRHGHPVRFIDGNPIVGYDKMKDCVRLLFRSGQSFDEPDLRPEGKFQAAEIRYIDSNQINKSDLARRINKAICIQRDYKNIVKRRGMLEKLTDF